MARLFFREVWNFPLAYLDARRYHVSLGTDETPAGRTSFGEEDSDRDLGRAGAPLGVMRLLALCHSCSSAWPTCWRVSPSWAGITARFSICWMEAFWIDPSLPAIILTAPMGVYFVSVLGLLFGVLKGFPRWSYAYLGMSFYFGWSYSNGSYYGVDLRTCGPGSPCSLPSSWAYCSPAPYSRWPGCSRAPGTTGRACTFALYAFTLPC